MSTTIQVKDLTCEIEGTGKERKIIYMIYPKIAGLSEKWLSSLAQKNSVAIAMIYVPADQWNNYLTPWPEPPESKGFPPFGGNAGEFRKILLEEILPEVEKELGMAPDVERDLLGVSLSALFTLWLWMQDDTFRSIASLSGSFWYSGFMDWFDSCPMPGKDGKAFFLLGTEEPKAKIKAYRSVGVNTEQVVARLKDAGIPVTFEWVPGNHFSDPAHRAEKGFDSLIAS